MLKPAFIKIMICAAFLSLTACDQGSSNAAPKINTIKILDIQPPLDKPLKTAEKIEMRVKVAYELNSDAATITLAVLRADGFGSKSLTSTFVVVKKGKGELLLKGEFMVPKRTKLIQVRVPLSPQQRGDTAPTEARTYDVIEVD